MKTMLSVLIFHKLGIREFEKEKIDSPISRFEAEDNFVYLGQAK